MEIPWETEAEPVVPEMPEAEAATEIDPPQDEEGASEPSRSESVESEPVESAPPEDPEQVEEAIEEVEPPPEAEQQPEEPIDIDEADPVAAEPIDPPSEIETEQPEVVETEDAALLNQANQWVQEASFQPTDAELASRGGGARVLDEVGGDMLEADARNFS